MVDAVEAGSDDKYWKVETCIDMCYKGTLKPMPDEIAWAVKRTPIALKEAWQSKHRMIRLCTALLDCNHLDNEQIKVIAHIAEKARAGEWETEADCVEFLDHSRSGLTSKGYYKRVYENHGKQAKYTYTQKHASVESLEQNISLAIEISMEAGGEAFGGKEGFKESINESYKKAMQITNEKSLTQDFEFKDGDNDCLYEKVVTATKYGEKRTFFLAIERFPKRVEGTHDGYLFEN